MTGRELLEKLTALKDSELNLEVKLTNESPEIVDFQIPLTAISVYGDGVDPDYINLIGY